MGVMGGRDGKKIVNTQMLFGSKLSNGLFNMYEARYSVLYGFCVHAVTIAKAPVNSRFGWMLGASIKLLVTGEW